MKTYEELLADLAAMKDERYRVFSERIVNVPAGSSVGVRTPLLRDYGKKLVKGDGFDLDLLLSFPNDVFEVRLLKCFAVGYQKMPFADKKRYIARCVPMIDGWGVCDLFCSTLKKIKKHREEFLPEIRKYVAEGTEFSQRFGYIMLLGCYMEQAYLPEIFSLLQEAKTQYYYTHMGAAWLIAEILVKFYEEGIAFLKTCLLEPKTVNKSIQKARESYRLTEEQKNYLKSLKK